MEGGRDARPEPKKKIQPTDVDISLNRAISAEKKKINPYSIFIPHNSKNSERRNYMNERIDEIENELK